MEKNWKEKDIIKMVKEFEKNNKSNILINDSNSIIENEKKKEKSKKENKESQRSTNKTKTSIFILIIYLLFLEYFLFYMKSKN